MELNEYQELARKTAIYPTFYLAGEITPEELEALIASGKLRPAAWVYPTLGLSGETGEVSERMKKLSRDAGGLLTPDQLVRIKKEVGDALWYIANVCHELNTTMSDVATENIAKLKARQIKGTLHGEGDER